MSNYTVNIKARPDLTFVSLGRATAKYHIHYADPHHPGRFTLCGRESVTKLTERELSSTRLCGACLRALQSFRNIEFTPETKEENEKGK